MRQSAGYSLLELAVVLAIVGLLAGGIIAGQGLLRGAELKSISASAQRYQTAIIQFRQQYSGLPGDIRNATNYWGAASCPNGPGSGTATCDGNGNRLIERWDEMYRSWQHLTNAKLISGNLSGTYTDVGGRGVGVPGENIPADRLPGSGWSMLSLNPNSDSEFGYSDASTRVANWLVVGMNSTSDYAVLPLVRTADAYEIDLKVDDGKPGSGSVLGGPAGQCATGNTGRTAAYLLNSTTNRCRMGFLIP